MFLPVAVKVMPNTIVEMVDVNCVEVAMTSFSCSLLPGFRVKGLGCRL